jgi:hypothetical protein
MLLIKYHDRIDIIAEFDPETGRTDILPRPQGLPVTGTDGWFSLLGGLCVVFYRQGGRLWLRAGERIIDLDRDPTIEWHREGDISSLTIGDQRGEIVLRYRTGPRSGPALQEDPTPFVDEEDWDLGLFLSNVMFDAERIELIRGGPK